MWQPKAILTTSKNKDLEGGGMRIVGKKLNAILFVGVILLLHPFAVFGDDLSGSIHGVVFIDEDGDGQYDPGEPVVEGVRIECTNGEIILEATTDSEGVFTFAIGIGIWQGMIYPPEGFFVQNDATREVVLETEEPLEAVWDFALVPDPVTDQPIVGIGEDSLEQDDEAGTAESGNQSEYYEGEFPVTPISSEEKNANQDDPQDGVIGVILPESGSPIALKWILVGLLALIVFVGASLILLGKRLQR
jgi:hypothetical protein